jgi:hypothetical protein
MGKPSKSRNRIKKLSNKSTGWLHLVYENILWEISHHCSVASLYYLSCTCKRLHTFLNPQYHIWKAHCLDICTKTGLDIGVLEFMVKESEKSWKWFAMSLSNEGKKGSMLFHYQTESFDQVIEIGYHQVCLFI